MKITKPTLTKRRSALIIFVASIIIASGITFALLQTDDGNLSNEELTKSADQTSTVQREQVVDEDDSSDTHEDAGLPPKPPYQDGSADGPSSGGDSPGVVPETPRVTRAGQSGDTIKVTALFQQNSAGYCELRLTKTGQPTVSRTADIVTGPSYYACGFTLPRSALPASGQWKAVVIHKIGGASASAQPKNIEVQ